MRVFSIPPQQKGGLAAFTPHEETLSLEVLSPMGDLREMAANLFAGLYRLDKAGLGIIYAESVPEIGLGGASVDRLYKAKRGKRDE